MITTIKTSSGTFIMLKTAIQIIIGLCVIGLFLFFMYEERPHDPEDGTYEHEAMKARGDL